VIRYSSVPQVYGNPDFHFSRMAEILRGRPVRRVRVDGVDAVFVNDPALIRTILVRDSKSYVRGDLFQKGRNLSRSGLLLEDESAHRHYRRLANPFLRAAKIDEYVPTMRGIARDAVTSWPAGRAVDIQTEMCWIAGAIALGALFPSRLPETSAALSDCLAVLARETIRKPLYGTAAPAQRQGPSSARLARARDDVRELLRSDIAEQLGSPDSGTGYLSALLSDSDERGDRVLTVDQVCDEAVMMLIAATVTTASVLSWALYVLSEQPSIEEELTEDLATGGAGCAARGIESWHYTFRFLMEVLRLYPPVWISCRKTRSRVTLEDHSIPRGVNVIFSSYLLHRDPDSYPDPNRLDPDRWLSVRPGIADGTLYIPFGIGPKGCIGEPFAWQELEVILGTVLQGWKLSTKPGSRVHAAAETTLHPHELLMIPQPRRRPGDEATPAVARTWPQRPADDPGQRTTG
jgi:cytochrome P450